MYQSHPSLVLGFHGCDRKIGEALLAGQKGFKPSENEYDWLGNGMYFWENAPDRARSFAQEVKENPKMGSIEDPFVIGAVIDLGRCFNLLAHQNLELLRSHYDLFVQLMEQMGKEIKPNAGGTDKVMRYLDCGVIELTSTMVKDYDEKLAFDSVRGVFWEGEELYPGAGFKAKNHIQIAIRNPNCIKGFFLPKDRNETFRPV